MGLLLGGSALVCESATEGSLIHSLRIEGSDRPLTLETRIGTPLRRDSVRRDVGRLWASGWFDDIQVHVSGEEGGSKVVFRIVERPRYHLRRVEFHPASERCPVRLMPGTLVDKKLAHELAAELTAQLVEEGFTDAEVASEIVPVRLHQADVRLRISRGRRYRVEQVRFSGKLAFQPEELQRMLRLVRPRTILPAMPGLWSGWKSQPVFSQERVEAELQALRSFYFGQGFWTATVKLGGIRFHDDLATISIVVHSGPRYRTEQAQLAERQPGKESADAGHNDISRQDLCSCLRRARRSAEQEGKLDFAVQLEVQPGKSSEPAVIQVAKSQTSEAASESQGVSLTARLQSGDPYRLGRIEFTGNHHFSDSTLRRSLLLNEGDLFDYDRLKGSLDRLNRLGLFETLTEREAELVRDPAQHRVDVTFHLSEAARGRWALSGSADPVQWLRPLQFNLGTRLPAWGSGPLQLSTYFAAASFSLLAPSLASTLLLQSWPRWQPLITLGRPYLPGEGWKSGFAILPQLGWRGSLIGSAQIHARRMVPRIKGETIDDPELVVPVWWKATGSDEPPQLVGSLLCETPKPRLAWARSASSLVLDWLLTASLF